MRELYREFVARRRRIEDEHERDTIQAWQVTKMSMDARSKSGLRALGVYLERSTTKPQTLAEMRHVLETAAVQYGLKIRKVKRRRE